MKKKTIQCEPPASPASFPTPNLIRYESINEMECQALEDEYLGVPLHKKVLRALQNNGTDFHPLIGVTWLGATAFIATQVPGLTPLLIALVALVGVGWLISKHFPR